ncbi:xanthine dehydrogenase family protein subunit M [Spirosoma taeanense]|uniref:Xanthine dehydrogenase family protein subunit M n=1 Tax=Spirosoma taeanense TaxID=2735870 RepID=A0A6M5Y9V6_9BACT|nr:xanthine dehydrogenase family protein subunit M [Spirosoma taeanense]QJW89612.1 xanthine dehydrogenase family protein subunit M [Spirosoma taeanense]
MHPFSYARPQDVKTALDELTAEPTHTAKFIAGGTNLIDLMKENVERPGRLVDINWLPLATITDTEGGGLRLGALVTNADTAYNEQVIARYPLLSQTILAGASPQLRNMATNGGNLFQRNRCFYFYDRATPCNKRQPGSGCGALNGYNRIHAILGTESSANSPQCIATHPSDMCVALAALEAVVRVTGPNGERTIPMADFHRLPGDEPQYDNTLQPDELVTAIDLPAKGFPDYHTYLKLRDRASYAFALVSVAVGLELDGDTITDARLALGGVAHKPWRRPEAEALLIGKPTTKENYSRAAESLLEGAQGFGHNTFKIELAKRAIVRALGIAARQEPTE